MQALRNGVKSLRSYVSTPCWVETNEAGRIGAAVGISGRVIFADFSSRTPGKIFRKNSDSPICPVVLCCSPDSEHPFFQQCAKDYPLMLPQQRGNDLGERMHIALTDALFRYRHAVLVGCDCPSLTADDLRQALQALENGSDCVIAPAEDGGYVLIGLNAPQPGLFDDMDWGIDSVMTETHYRVVKAGLSLHELGMQWDVDTIQDWKRYLSA